MIVIYRRQPGEVLSLAVGLFLSLVLCPCGGAIGYADETLLPCAVLGHERCRCTPDLREFQCRGAGFTGVPDLPYTINKL
ncbi:hypothetical protein D910_01010 [Dendroctonus ponderosae]|uniref:Uncharacterized protein n=1 Tax=Dendroctonus ponderosae TaxID=77166 RepID=U4USK5_DENPD|nr:hypothetical protein D910_01010 [Dendroctonus ponderosae]